VLLTNPETMRSGATFSPCRKYRYRLWREWDPTKPTVAFLALNPSTADETVDDPTIRRCVAFARSWSFGRYEMLNVFGWRATDPELLKRVFYPDAHDVAESYDPLDCANSHAIVDVMHKSSRLVLAWGSHKKIRAILTPREETLRAFVETVAQEMARDGAHIEIGHLGTNADGSPKHPLYLAASTPFVRVAGGVTP